MTAITQENYIARHLLAKEEECVFMIDEVRSLLMDEGSDEFRPVYTARLKVKLESLLKSLESLKKTLGEINEDYGSREDAKLEISTETS